MVTGRTDTTLYLLLPTAKQEGSIMSVEASQSHQSGRSEYGPQQPKLRHRAEQHRIRLRRRAYGPIVGRERSWTARRNHRQARPSQRDRHPAEGQVEIRNDRTVLHPRACPARPTRLNRNVLLDRDLAYRAASRVGEDTDVFQAHEMRDDLARIRVHRGVEDSLFRHTSHGRPGHPPCSHEMLCLGRRSPTSRFYWCLRARLHIGAGP